MATCKRRGCDQPTTVGKRGHLTDYCVAHLEEQRALWRTKEHQRRAASSNDSTVRTLRICPHCGRGYWLSVDAALTCDCDEPSSHADNINLALIVPREDGGGTVSLYDAAFTAIGMTSYSPEPGDYIALRERLSPDYVIAVVSEV